MALKNESFRQKHRKGMGITMTGKEREEREERGNLHKLGSVLADLLFIPKCAACFTPLPDNSKALCGQCSKRYLSERGSVCYLCGKNHMFCDCRIHYNGRSFPLIHVTSYSITREAVSKSLTLHIKDDRLDTALDFIADEMSFAFLERAGRDMAGLIGRWSPDNTRITWVPRSEKAMRSAGHDQGRELALRLGKRLETPVFPSFYNGAHSAQKKLNRQARLENAENSFMLIAEPEDVMGKNIILADDIVTSGASLGVCAEKLLMAGAENVIMLVFAKTDHRKGLEEETLYYLDH